MLLSLSLYLSEGFELLFWDSCWVTLSSSVSLIQSEVNILTPSPFFHKSYRTSSELDLYDAEK